MRKILSLVLIAVMACGTSAFAQRSTSGENNFMIHVGPTFPLGHFGGVAEDWLLNNFISGTDGCAGVGFNVGAQYKFGLPINGLGVFAGVDFFFNGMNKEIQEKIYDLADNSVTDITSKPRYYNIPIIVGLNYQYMIANGLGVYAEGGVGVDFRAISKFQTEFLSGSGIEAEIKYKTSGSFAGRVGAGVVYNRVTLGVDFDFLGANKITIADSDEDDLAKTHNKLKTNLLTIRLGLIL